MKVTWCHQAARGCVKFLSTELRPYQRSWDKSRCRQNQLVAHEVLSRANLRVMLWRELMHQFR